MIDFWAAALALSLLLYVLLDGFDLGVGMLFPFARSEAERRQMMSAISPVWDGNETWLVITAAVLFGAFPIVYSITISAFYLPILLMLVSLILRGVAFEFRTRARSACVRSGTPGFVGGSYRRDLHAGDRGRRHRRRASRDDGRPVQRCGPLFWFQPLALNCGLGLCIGYALMGAVLARRQDRWRLARDFAYRIIPGLCSRRCSSSWPWRWRSRLRATCRSWTAGSTGPISPAFPAVGLVAAITLVSAWRRRIDWLPFPATRRDLRRRIRHARRVFLALHDSVLDHDRRGCSAGIELAVPVLGRRNNRPADHSHLQPSQSTSSSVARWQPSPKAIERDTSRRANDAYAHYAPGSEMAAIRISRTA